jgi:hypothetical protein
MALAKKKIMGEEAECQPSPLLAFNPPLPQAIVGQTTSRGNTCVTVSSPAASGTNIWNEFGQAAAHGTIFDGSSRRGGVASSAISRAGAAACCKSLP